MTNEKSEKILSIVYKTFHVLFSLDFGFFKFKSYKIRVFVRTWSLVQSLSFSIFYIYWIENADHEFDTKTFWYYHLYCFQYLAFVTVLTFFKHDLNFCNIFSDLRIIDEELDVDSASFKAEIKILSLILSSITFKIVNASIYCSYYVCSEGFFQMLLYLAVTWCTEFVQITCALVFYLILCRLKKLVAILESTNFEFVLAQLLYKSVIDLAEKYKHTFEILYITALLFNVAEAMSTIYYSVSAIWDVNVTSTPLDLCSDFAIILTGLSLTFAPAFCAGMMTSQANRIKVILNDKLLEQRDEAVVFELERFIRYVEARPCRFRVCKVIPLDADLLGLVLSFCVTYLIVIIQFTRTN